MQYELFFSNGDFFLKKINSLNTKKKKKKKWEREGEKARGRGGKKRNYKIKKRAGSQ